MNQTTAAQAGEDPIMSTTSSLTYDVFVNEPPRHSGLLPNGEPKDFSPIASTLICGSEDAVLTDPRSARLRARWMPSMLRGS